MIYQNVYEEAIRMYEKAAEYKLLKGDSTSLSLVLRDIARVYDMVDKNDSALLYFQKAAIIANETGNRHRYSGRHVPYSNKTPVIYPDRHIPHKKR